MTARRKHPRSLIAVCIFISCWTLLGKSPAAAQTREPTIHSDADYTFGQTMWFRLMAEDAAAVNEVSLFVRAPEFASTYSVKLPVEPSDHIELVQPVDLARLKLAPFTTVTYWWVLTSPVTGELTVPKQTLAYDDDRFEWKVRSRQDHRVYWTGNDAAVGQIALDILTEALPEIQALISSRDVAPFRLFVYPTSADLRSALRLTGRDWSGGHVDPELGVLLVTAVNARTAAIDLRRSIPHEVAHVLLFKEVGSVYDDVPLWFNEGLATFAEMMPDPNYEAILQDAVEQETTIHFSDLCERFPDTEERALLAYAQSASLVSFIQETHGHHRLRELIRVYGDGVDCRAGVSQTLHVSLEELERSWLREQQPRLAIIQLLSDNSLLLVLLAGGFVIARLLLLSPTTGEGEHIRSSADRETR